MSNWLPMRPVRITKVVFYDQFGLPIVSSGSPMPEVKLPPPPPPPPRKLNEDASILSKIHAWILK